MADATPTDIGAGVMAAMAGTAAAASHPSRATRYRKGGQNMYIGGARFGTNGFDTASYMNSLRAPAPSISSARGASNQGVGVNIHYQPSCAYHGPFSLDDGFGYHGENYARPMNYDISQGYHATGPSGSLCGCPQCYWRDFLTNDIEKYKATCQQLRGTYIWNLHELVRRHRAAPSKSRAEKEGELEKLYWYYVGRVREIYDNHCQHHRLLFQDVCLTWVMPERITLREDDLEPPSRDPTPQSRHSSASFAPSPRDSTPLPRRGSAGRWSLDTGLASKGKEKEVIPRVDIGGDMQSSSAHDDKSNDDEKEVEAIPSPDNNSATTPEPKHKRISVQQRLRQLWLSRHGDRSSDKADLTQAGGKDDKHEGNERGSVA
ncbi:hypothetical protein F4861DRAFT_454848 [Xylaria intraflava]|nr:hypothetical protein F4861DRAFT_454848 [Xylaria intraflava]